jgi:hypothetical protein
MISPAQDFLAHVAATLPQQDRSSEERNRLRVKEVRSKEVRK